MIESLKISSSLTKNIKCFVKSKINFESSNYTNFNFQVQKKPFEDGSFSIMIHYRFLLIENEMASFHELF